MLKAALTSSGTRGFGLDTAPLAGAPAASASSSPLPPLSAPRAAAAAAAAAATAATALPTGLLLLSRLPAPTGDLAGGAGRWDIGECCGHCSCGGAC